MRSSLAIDIAAPAGLVFDLARDIERWPALLAHYRDVRVLEHHTDGSTTARMLAVRPVVAAFGYGIPVAWRARVWTDPASLGLTFRHRGGATSGMDVAWRIEPKENGCRVTIEHHFEPRVPGWAAFVDRLFVRPIASQTLATFKSIAEAVAVATAGQSKGAESATATGRAAASKRRRAAKTST